MDNNNLNNCPTSKKLSYVLLIIRENVHIIVGIANMHMAKDN
jgi:hypothetical protein